jgi:peptide/nickel transport system permease protein
MWQFIAVRTFQAVLTILLVTMVVFAITRISGDPAKLLIPPEVPSEEIPRYREAWGLNDPLPVQYLKFVTNATKGDFGTSYRYDVPVSELVWKRVQSTAKLALAAVILTAVVAIPLGVVAAVYRGTVLDTLVRVLALSGQAVPSFWLGLILVLIFAVKFHWLPATGDQNWKSFILPSITLSSFSMAAVTRLTRSSMLDVLDSEYIKLVRAKGMPECNVIFKHALRNAAIPIITILGLQLGGLIGGSVLVESIFNWPGVGQLSVDAVFAADYAVIQTIVLIGALSFVVINLSIDLLYAVVDPRIRY